MGNPFNRAWRALFPVTDRNSRRAGRDRLPDLQRPLTLETLERRILPANVTLSPAVVTNLGRGLDNLTGVLRAAAPTGPLGQQIPLTSDTVGSIADTGLDAVAAKVKAYADGSNLSSDGLVAVLRGLSGDYGERRLTVDTGTVRGGVGLPAQDEIVFHLRYTAVRDATTAMRFEPDVGQLTLASPVSLTERGTAVLEFDFGISTRPGLLPADAVFVRVQTASLALAATGANLRFDGAYGFAGITSTGGQVNAAAIVNLTVLNPDGDARGNVTQAELVGTPPANLLRTATAGSVSANFPVAVAVGTWALTGQPALAVASSDPFSGQSLAVTANADAAALTPFANVRSQDVGGELQHLSALGDALAQSSIFGTAVPLLPGVTFGQASDLRGVIARAIVQPLGLGDGQAGTQTFATAQALGQQLAAALGQSAFAIGPKYDPSTRLLTYRLVFSGAGAVGSGAAGVPDAADRFRGLLADGTINTAPRDDVALTLGIDLTPPAAGGSLDDRFFIRDATLKVAVTLAGTGVQLRGTLGALDLATATATASGTASVQVAIRPPGAGPAFGLVTLRQAFNAVGSDPASLVAATTWGGSATLTAPQLKPTGGFLSGLVANPTLTLTVADPQNPYAVAGMTNADFAPLLRFQYLGVQDVFAAFDQFKAYLDSASQTKVFGTKLATIDRSITHVMDHVKRFAAVVDRFRADPPQAINDVVQKLMAALGNEIGGVPVTAQLTSDGVLKLGLSFHYAVADTTPLDLDLSQVGLALPGLVGVGLDGRLAFTGQFDLTLNLGVDLSNPAQPTAVLYDTTKAVVTGKVMGTNLAASVQFGPLVLSARTASALLDKDGDPATPEPAVFTLGLKPAAIGRYSLRELGLSVLTTNLNGKVMAELPLYPPLVGGALLGTVSLRVDDLTTPASTAKFLTSTQFLTNLLNGQGLAPNLDSLIEGIERVFRKLDDGLARRLLDRLPLVGRGLPDVVKLFDRARDHLVSQLQALVDRTPAKVRDLLFRELGPSGLNLLRDYDNNHVINSADVRLTDVPGDTLFQMHIGADSLTFETGLRFDLGLPALGLSLNAPVKAQVGWDMWTGFGVNKTLGFYLDTSHPMDFALGVTVTTPNLSAVGRLSFLRVTASDNPAAPTQFQAGITANLQEPSGDNKLTLGELTGEGFSFERDLPATLTGSLLGSLLLKADFGTDASPSLSATLDVTWGFSAAVIGTPWDRYGSPPDVRFHNVRLHLGTFLSGFVRPVLESITSVTESVRPVLGVLTQRVPVISDLEHRTVTFMDLLGISPAQQRVVRVVDALDRLAKAVVSLPAGDLSIALGGFAVSGGDARGDGTLAQATPKSDGDAPPDWATQLPGGAAKSFLDDLFHTERSDDGFGLKFPFLQDRFAGFRLLLGQDVTLFSYRMPSLGVSTGFSEYYPLFGPLGVRIGGEIGAGVKLQFGFDTSGLRRGKPFDGFYVDRANTAIGLYGNLTAAAELNLLVVRAGVAGGLFASIRLTPHDPNGDGKVRLDEIAANVRGGLLGAFDASGDLSAKLYAYLKWWLPFKWHKWSWNIAEVRLLNFNRTNPPSAPAAGPYFTADHTADDGQPGSLRWAINAANAWPDSPQILFNVPNTDLGFVDVDSGLPGGDAAPDVYKFEARSPLPALNNPRAGITVAGGSQTEATGDTNPYGPEVLINGYSAGPTTDGLTVRSNNNVLEDLAVNGFGGNGVVIDGGDNNRVSNLYAGVTATGKASFGNGRNGIRLTNGAAGNVIEYATVSGNVADGIILTGAGTTNNTVRDSFIGTAPDGLQGLSNGGSGVVIAAGASNNTIGGAALEDGNVISGNARAGVEMTDRGTGGNRVLGNQIGTGNRVFLALSNLGPGVWVHGGAANNVVGGTAAGAGNTISGNGSAGVTLDGVGSDGNRVTANAIGINWVGVRSLGNSDVGVRIAGGAKNNVVELNVISGNVAGGFVITGQGTNGNTAGGNYVGTSPDGLLGLSNGGPGGLIGEGAANNVVGGTASSDRNVLSGNGGPGVSVANPGTDGNQVMGNVIGLNADGSAGLNNVGPGVLIAGGPGGTRVVSNTVSGNSGSGVRVDGAAATYVGGNMIGVDPDGRRSLANLGDGVEVVGANVVVEKNVLSGNGGRGVSVSGAGSDGTAILGNKVGVSGDGTQSIGNLGGGVSITDAGRGVAVGGTSAGSGNLVSGNGRFGIEVAGPTTDGTLIYNNTVGLSASQAASLNNAGPGIWSRGAVRTMIGSTNGGANVIAGNSGSGVLFEGAGIATASVEGNAIGQASVKLPAIANGRFGVEARFASTSVEAAAVEGFLAALTNRNTLAGGAQSVYTDAPPAAGPTVAQPVRLLTPAYFPVPSGMASWYTLANQSRPGVSEVIAIANVGGGTNIGSVGGPLIPANYDRAVTLAFYRDVFAYAASRGVKLVGYVSTRYGERPIEEVKADIDAWKTMWPQATGIFFDEQAAGTTANPGAAAAKLSYYKELRAYVLSKYGSTANPVVTNPGTVGTRPADLEAYVSDGQGNVPVADIMVVFEDVSLASYVEPAWVRNYHRGRFAALVHHAASPDAAKAAILARQIGAVYVTDDGSDGNTWDRLPAYLSSFTTWLRQVNTAQVAVAPPQVQSVIVNDGSVQRSIVKSLTVTFSGLVTLPSNGANAFSLTGPSGAVTVAVDLSRSTATQTVAVLTFSGSGSVGGSLADGRYTFKVLGSQVRDAAGNLLDGAATGTPGGDFTTLLHRLYGDANGDRVVNGADLTPFIIVFGAPSTTFDANFDGVVNGADLTEFIKRFGLSV